MGQSPHVFSLRNVTPQVDRDGGSRAITCPRLPTQRVVRVTRSAAVQSVGRSETMLM